MKGAVGCIALALCLAMPAPVGAQAAPKGTITGVTPYSLGMTTTDALAADATLATATGTACAPAAKAYATRVTAPIGGYPYTANLVLCFLQDQLGAIYLTWSAGTSRENPIAWQLATRSLAAQLAGSYAPPVVTRRYTVDDDMGAVMEMSDAQGNLLTMIADPGHHPDIGVTYMSTAYDQAVNGKRITVTSY